MNLNFFQYLLSEFPLAVGIAHGYTLGFFDGPVLDGGEAVEEACGEEAARFLPLLCHRFIEYTFGVLLYLYGFIRNLLVSFG